MKKIIIAAVVPAMVAFGMWFAAGSASAAHTTHTSSTRHQATVQTRAKISATSRAKTAAASESQAESESAADAATQHADCLKAGIDDTVQQNVQYDDQTGACSIDAGGSDNGGNN